MMNGIKTGILAAIRNWRSLLGLIVLVAESVMLAAMAITPESNPLFPLYPVFMLLFLLVPVVGLFWIQYMKSKSRQTNIPGPLSQEEGGGLVTVDTSGKSITEEETKKLDPDTEIIEQRLGFTFHRPKLDMWSEPTVLTQYELLIERGVEKSPEEFRVLELISRANPLGDMLLQTKSFILTIGDPTEILFTDMTSTKVIDGIIEVMRSELEENGEEIDEEAITEMRKELAQGVLLIDRYTMRNSFIVNIIDKALAKTSLLEPNLGNVFATFIRGSPDSVSTLDASKDSILWSTSFTTSNVLIRGRLQDFTTYRLYLLTESKSKFFLVQIEYSPQTKLSPDVWQDLKEMLNSFQMIL